MLGVVGENKNLGLAMVGLIALLLLLVWILVRKSSINQLKIINKL